jgi:uncharacterized membrane protein YuzA (DUF378 family)
MKLNVVDILAYVLTIIGGINWGLVGFFKYNLVDSIFGVGATVSRVVYALVGLAALYLIYVFVKTINMMGKTEVTQQ